MDGDWLDEGAQYWEVIPSVISKLATATWCTPAGRVPSVANGEDERKLEGQSVSCLALL